MANKSEVDIKPEYLESIKLFGDTLTNKDNIMLNYALFNMWPEDLEIREYNVEIEVIDISRRYQKFHHNYLRQKLRNKIKRN